MFPCISSAKSACSHYVTKAPAPSISYGCMNDLPCSTFLCDWTFRLGDTSNLLLHQDNILYYDAPKPGKEKLL